MNTLAFALHLEKTKDNQKEIMDINTLYTTIEHLKQTKEEYHFNKKKKKKLLLYQYIYERSFLWPDIKWKFVV